MSTSLLAYVVRVVHILASGLMHSSRTSPHLHTEASDIWSVPKDDPGRLTVYATAKRSEGVLEPIYF